MPRILRAISFWIPEAGGPDGGQEAATDRAQLRQSLGGSGTPQRDTPPRGEPVAVRLEASTMRLSTASYTPTMSTSTSAEDSAPCAASTELRCGRCQTRADDAQQVYCSNCGSRLDDDSEAAVGFAQRCPEWVWQATPSLLRYRLGDRILFSHTGDEWWSWGYLIDSYGRVQWNAIGAFLQACTEVVEDTPGYYEHVRQQDCFARTLLTQGFDRYHDLPFLGEQRDDHSDEARHQLYFDYDGGAAQRDDGGFAWSTYRRVRDTALALAQAWRGQLGLAARSAVGILGRNCVDWVLADLACLFGSYVSIPLYSRQDADRYRFIVEQADVQLLVVDAEHYRLLHALAPFAGVRFVLFGAPLPDRPHVPTVAGLIASQLPQLAVDDWLPTAPLDVATVMYTSGSTGRPKGAIMTEDRWHRFLGRNYRVTYPQRVITASQLPHIMERQNIYITMLAGGCYALYGGDPSGLLDAMRAFRPSELTVVPRFFQVLHASYQAELRRAQRDAGVTATKSRVDASSPYQCSDGHQLVVEQCQHAGYEGGYTCDRCQTVLLPAPRWRCDACSYDVCFRCLPDDSNNDDKKLTDKAAQLLGVESVAAGQRQFAADRAAEAEQSLEAALLDKYRQSLGGQLAYIGVGGALSSAELRQWIERCFKCLVLDGYGATEVGGITTENVVSESASIRLESVPELGYSVDDVPNPRGQILVKTDLTVPGYYRDPEATRECFTDDGYWRSGDIGERTSDGKVRIIDRVKNIFKLSQGEYIAPEPLEQTFCRDGLVTNCFVFAEPAWDHLLAVVVPDVDNLRPLAAAADPSLVDAPADQLCRSPVAVDAVLAALRTRGADERLAHYQLPRAVLLDPEPFSFERGFVTSSMKPVRAALVQHYRAALHALEASLNARQPDLDVDAVGELVARCLAATDSSGDDLLLLLDSRLRSLLHNGTDSLSAMRLLIELRSRCAAAAQLSMQQLFQCSAAELVAALRNGGSAQADAALADDWQASSTDSDASPSSSVFCAGQASSEQTDVFVTGATGAIASELVRQLLQQEARKIVCLVRAASDDEARTRLLSVLGVETDRLEVLAGDVSAEWFGWSRERFVERAASTALCYHLAAHVNWSLPYAALRATNVVGTRRVVDFCTAAPGVRLVYVSTASVASSYQIDGATPRDLRDACRRDGYSLTKLVAERFVHHAVATRALAAVVVRPAMITGHSQTGQCNRTDFVPRYLLGIVQLGCYPVSDRRQDMLPVDVTAAVLADLPSAAADLPCGSVVAVADLQPISFADIGACVAGHCAAPPSAVDYAAFRARLLASPTNPLFPFLDSVIGAAGLAAGLDPAADYSFDARLLAAVLARRGQPDKQCLLRHYLANLIPAAALTSEKK